MHKSLVALAFLVSGLSLFSCKDEGTDAPKVVPLPVDTASADQYVVCVIDTIQYIAYVKDGAPDKVTMTMNNDVVTKFFSESQVKRQGQELIRNLTLHLYDFKSRRIGTYIGGQIFVDCKTEVLTPTLDIEDKNWTIFNANTNRIQVSYADSSIARGNFTFKMQNTANPSQFIEVTKGAFKVRIR
jgi:hypothetical protein